MAIGRTKSGLDSTRYLCFGTGFTARLGRKREATYFVTTLVSTCPLRTCLGHSRISDTNFAAQLLRRLPQSYDIALTLSAQ